MSPCETASEIYSKCIVSPFISTPIAIIASKGPVEVLEVFVRDVRSEVDPPRRSPALAEAEVDDWI